MSEGIDIVDCHVHVFSPDLVRRREAFHARDAWFAALYENPRAALVPCETLIEEMDTADVRRSILCGFPWADPALCREHNDYLADAVRRNPSRLSWLGIVVPGDPSAPAEARRCLELGAVGIGELNADAQGFDWRNEGAHAPLVELCLGYDAPWLIHASEAVGHQYPGKGTATPDKLLEFLRSFGQTKVVAAHWGGGLPFHELMPEVEAMTRNVVYDCGASTYLYRPRVFRSVLDIVGPERVLFGSDYPVLRMDRFTKRVLALDWRDDDEKQLVMGANARRFFRLPDDPAERR
jgi:predicted TIM-barrel fold metal-dependent hydrolase